jgi:excisionase family DNA binding protein
VTITSSNQRQLLYKPESVGVLLDMGRTSVYGLMASGELRSVKIGRSRRIPADALEEYVSRLAGGSAA